METITWAGLDVHARSTEAAAIDAESGEPREDAWAPAPSRSSPGSAACGSRSAPATKRDRQGTASTAPPTKRALRSA